MARKIIKEGTEPAKRRASAPAGKPKSKLKAAADEASGFSVLEPADETSKTATAAVMQEQNRRPAILSDDSVMSAIAEHVNGLVGIAPQAKIRGLELVEAWLQEVAAFDLMFPTIAVEVPFFIILEKYTVVVGMQDRIALDAAGLFGCEWKSTKGTTRFWNEDRWIEEIQNAPQISIYGLGQHEGFFDVNDSTNAEWPCGEIIRSSATGPVLWQPKVKSPRVMVRAITKESPPVIWPTERQHAFFEIDAKRLNTVREALIRKADMIRVAKSRKSLPWELTGIQCGGRFFKACAYKEDCVEGRHPEGYSPISSDDPGSAALVAAQELLRVPLDDERVVVLSASSYSDTVECLELHRRNTLGKNQDDEDDPNLQTGTVLHAGVACFYKEASKRI